MRGGAMAARITDRKKKKIIADWIEMQSYSAVAKRHGVTHQTVKRIVSASPDIAQKVQQKKEENTADMMAYMESQKAAMQEAITLHLKALTDPEKISAATLSQIATSFGIIVDKATRNTASGNDSLNKLDGLIKEFRDAIKPETD
jgi:transposase-like protein